MSDIESRVITLVADHLDIDPSQIKKESKFQDDLGADSLDQVEMVMRIEEEFGVDIPDEAAEKIVKISDAVEYIEKLTKKSA